MGDDKDKSPLGPISGVLLIFAAFGATFLVQPFKADRPAVPEIRESYEKVNARLWQDPFRAILDASKGSDAEPEAACELDVSKSSAQKAKKKPKQSKKGNKSINSSESRLQQSIADKKKISILGVMVPGAPYDTDTEMRMRLRYAVLLGLCRLGFIPEDHEHIEFVRIRPLPKKNKAWTQDKSSAGKLSTKKNTLSNIMPYEWMSDKQGGSILVLWINDNVFRSDPLQYLSNLASHLKGLDSKTSIKDFKVIGPAASDTLAKMVTKDAPKGSPREADSSLFKGFESVSIYSAMATVDEKFLFGEETDDQDKIEKILRKTVGPMKEFIFKRTVGKDARLAEVLVKELKNRKIGIQDKNTHIVLVTEFDTLYGHSISQSFKAAFGKDPMHKQVHVISYLRGIDGRLPGEKEEQKGDEKTDAKSSDPFRDIKKLEQPVGKSQYDYLRRLADEIYRLDQDLLYVTGTGSVKAIGILGSDFYDKYLVLQALRQRLPDAVYFTTDLDARMLHPDHTQWTRNLLVASNFGLSLRKDDQVDIQGGVPPFRDNYQTSVFFTILRAFGEKYLISEPNVLTLIRKPTNEIPSLLFEIGRYRPVDLNPGAATGTVQPGRDCVTPPPEWYKGSFWRIMLIVTVMLFLAMIVLYFTSSPINTFMRCSNSWAMTAVRIAGVTIIIVCFIGVIASFIYRVSHQTGQEPFSLFEGISIWPTQLLRLAAIMLSGLFLYWSRRDRKRNRESIEKKLFKEHANPPSSAESPPFDQIDWRLKEVAPGTTLSNLWSAYMRRDSSCGRFWRVSLIVIFYLGLWGLFIPLFGMPVAPVRGDTSFLVNRLILFFTIIMFAILAFYVLDVTRTCRKFVGIASIWLTERPDSSDLKCLRVQIEEEWTLIRLIAMRTEVVGKFIFYPLIIWFFMFISRFQYFDNWTTPQGLAVVICVGVLLPWICAVLLRRSAEHARSRIEGSLEDRLHNLRASGWGGKDSAEREDAIKFIGVLIEKVRNIRQGAFAPFRQHPVVQSLIIPFSGVGGAYLIDFFTKTNF